MRPFAGVNADANLRSVRLKPHSVKADVSLIPGCVSVEIRVAILPALEHDAPAVEQQRARWKVR
jgi:hypothetical protein